MKYLIYLLFITLIVGYKTNDTPKPKVCTQEQRDSIFAKKCQDYLIPETVISFKVTE